MKTVVKDILLFTWAALGLIGLAYVVDAAVTGATQDVEFSPAVFTRMNDYVRIGHNAGTRINLLEIHELTFNGNTATDESNAGANYYVTTGWKAITSGTPGAVKVSIGGGTLTATAAGSTSGTLTVAVFGTP